MPIDRHCVAERRPIRRLHGQKALDERVQSHGPAAQMPAAGGGMAPPALHHDRRMHARLQTQAVAIFGVGGLGHHRQLDGLGLGVAEGGHETRFCSVVAQACGEAPGGTGGIAVVMEIEMEAGLFRRLLWEAAEAVGGAGSQGEGASCSCSVPPLSQRAGLKALDSTVAAPLNDPEPLPRRSGATGFPQTASASATVAPVLPTSHRRPPPSGSWGSRTCH